MLYSNAMFIILVALFVVRAYHFRLHIMFFSNASIVKNLVTRTPTAAAPNQFVYVAPEITNTVIVQKTEQKAPLNAQTAMATTPQSTRPAQHLNHTWRSNNRRP